LIERGYTVAALARRADWLDAIAETHLRPYPCDVVDRAAVRATIARIADELGGIDALVNNAGVTGGGELETWDDDTIDRLIDTNVRGAIGVAQAAIPALKARRGTIVNVGSTAVVRAVSGTSVYAATKGALEGLTRGLAFDLAGDHVRVNAVRPALVDTDLLRASGMSDDAWVAYRDGWGDGYPVGRVGTATDVAAMIVYLLSDAAAWMTGSIVTVDGGHSVGRIERAS
jgi:3-oxoacyl-[acyl-carrier protein] reductase